MSVAIKGKQLVMIFKNFTGKLSGALHSSFSKSSHLAAFGVFLSFILLQFYLAGLFSPAAAQNISPVDEFSPQNIPQVENILDQHFNASAGDTVLIRQGRLASGPCYTIASYGGISCINNGGYLDIFSTVNPSAPLLLSRSLLDFVPADMLLNQNFLFVRNATDKLLQLDLTKPGKPRLVNKIDLGPEPIFAWKIYGKKIFLAEGNGLTILDISKPGRIETVLADFPLFKDFIFSIGLSGNQLFALVNRSLFVVDISDVQQPEILSEFTLQNVFNNLAVKNNLVYLTGPEEMEIFDFTDITSPKLISETTFNCPAGEIFSFIQGNHFYLNCRGHELTVFDISNPVTPLQVQQFKGKIFDVSANDSLLQFANYNVFRIIQAPDFQYFQEVSRIETGEVSELLGVREDHLYRRNSKGRISVLTISNKNQPILAKPLPIKLGGKKLKFFKNFAFQTAGDSLFVFDFEDALNPELLEKYYLGFSAWDMEVFANRLLLSSYQNGLTIFDLKDPRQPEETANIGNLKLGKIQVKGTRLYGEDISSFYTVSLQNPDHPEVENRYYPNGYINDFCIGNNRAFLCIDDAGLLVLNISDPAIPVFAENIPGRFKACATQSDYLFTLPDLKVFDLSKSDYLRAIKDYRLDDHFGVEGELLPSGNFLLVNEKNLGLYIFGNRETKKKSRNVSFSEGFPNPFNSTIRIRYQLKQDSRVQIDIFDVQGHHVKSLLKGFKQQGEYNISWDAINSFGQPVASGLYLYRIIAGELTDTQKILLIR